MRAVPAEPEDGVDVARGLGGAVQRLLALLLARTEGCWDVCLGLVGAAEDGGGVHRAEDVERPDFDLGVERADGDVVSE